MSKKEQKKERNQQIQAYTYILQFSINMIVPIFACTFLGYWLDIKLHISYIVIIGFFFGAIVGANSIYKISRKMIKKDELSSGYPVVTPKQEESDKDDKLS